MPRPISDIWEHYLLLNQTDGKKHVTCSYCSLEYKHAMANKLRRHLMKCNKCPNDVKNLYKHNTTMLHSSQEATGSPSASSNMARPSPAIARTSMAMEPATVPIDLDEGLERDDDDDGPSEESSVSLEETHLKESIRKEIRTHTPEPLESVHISDSNYDGRHLSANLSFGEYVANKLNNYDSYTRSQVEFKISKILFDADMGMFRKPERQFPPQYTTRYSDQQEVSGSGDLKTQCNFMQTQDSMPGPSVLTTLLNK